jgi:hemerythrin-like metal-binding protein
VVWQKDFELGVEQIDKTHEEFIGLLSIAQNSSKAELTEVFAKIISHTKAHFKSEQEMMQEISLSSQKEHTDEHDKLLFEMDYFSKHPLMLRSYINERLPEWFKLHIATMDAALAAAVKNKNT